MSGSSNLISELNRMKQKYFPIPDSHTFECENNDKSNNNSSENINTKHGMLSSKISDNNHIASNIQNRVPFIYIPVVNKNTSSEYLSNNSHNINTLDNNRTEKVSYPIKLSDYENHRHIHQRQPNQNQNRYVNKCNSQFSRHPDEQQDDEEGEVFDPSYLQPSVCQQMIDQNRSTLKFYSLASAGISCLALIGFLLQIFYTRYFDISLKANLSRQV